MIAFGPSWKPADRLAPRTVRLGPITVSVRSDLEEVATDFAGLYRGSPRCDPRATQTIRMDVRRVRGSVPFGERYRIYGDGEAMGKLRRRQEVLPFLEWGINWRVIITRSDFLQIHAAVMFRSQAGVILAGGTGSGKSTLAAALVSRGWNYGGDELTLIDPQSGFVHPFPKAICIKSGAFDIIDRLNLPLAGRRYYVKGIKGRVGYINPYDVDGETVAMPGPVRFIVFPKYSGGLKSRLFPIPRARAVYNLVSCALNRSEFTDHGVSILSSVTEGAQCVGLDAGPIEETCDLLETLVDGGS